MTDYRDQIIQIKQGTNKENSESVGDLGIQEISQQLIYSQSQDSIRIIKHKCRRPEILRDCSTA